jgi:hypothetical protein
VFQFCNVFILFVVNRMIGLDEHTVVEVVVRAPMPCRRRYVDVNPRSLQLIVNRLRWYGSDKFVLG